MKWLTFESGSGIAHGWLDGDDVVVTGTGDLSAVVAGTERSSDGERLPAASVRLLPPLLAPGKIVAVAANYQAHVTETGSAERDTRTATPRLFLKPTSSLAAPGTPLPHDPITTELDWEVELAVVIGRKARRVPREQALEHVFGYATSNDISARSLLLGAAREGDGATTFFDWLAGKWLDGSAPMGPWLVSADEVTEPQDLRLTLTVNDTVHQDGNTAEMIHDVAELISFASTLMTLHPGDVLMTGTPSGVGAASGTYLNPDDVMVAEVEGLGRLVTPVLGRTGPESR